MQLATTDISTGEALDDIFGALDVRDTYTLPLSRLHVSGEDGRVDADIGEPLSLTETAARQLSAVLHIPPRFTLQSPNEMAAHALNFQLALHDENMTVITEGGRIVGVVSARYEPANLQDILEELGVLTRGSGRSVSGWWRDGLGTGIRYLVDSEVTEPRVGDVVKAGVDLLIRENTNKGLGVQGVIHRLVCKNGATVRENARLTSHLQRENWRDQSSRVAAALDAFDAVVQQTRAFMDELPALTRDAIELPLTDDDGERSRLVRGSLRVVGLPAVYTDSVSDALRAEEPSLFGYYNAVTRLGRDAVEPRVRARFERAGIRTITQRDALAEVFTAEGEA